MTAGGEPPAGAAGAAGRGGPAGSPDGRPPGRPPGSPDARARIDKWLWAARFFKTRAQAAVAITGGKVDLNGDRAKRSKLVKPGDVICVRKGEYTWTLTVLVISERRGPPAVGQSLWEELPESVAERERIRAERALEREFYGPPPPRLDGRKGRPTKRDRRALTRLKLDE